MSGLRSEVMPEVVGGTPPVVHPGHPGRDAAHGPGFCSVQVVTGHVREFLRHVGSGVSESECSRFRFECPECETTSFA